MDSLRYCPICDKIIDEDHWHHCPNDIHKWSTDSKFGDSKEVLVFSSLDLARLLYKMKLGNL